MLEFSQTNFESARQIARQFQAWPSLLYRSKRINDLMILLVNELELGAESPYPVDMRMAFQRPATQNPIAVFLLNITRDLVQKGLILSLKSGLEARLKSFKRSVTGKLRMFAGTMRLQLSNFDRELARLEISLQQSIRSLQHTVGMDVTNDYTISEEFFKKAQQLPPLHGTSIDDWAEFGWELLKHLTNDQPEVYPKLRKFGSRHENKYRQSVVKQRFGEVNRAEVEKLKKMGVGQQSEESTIRSDIGTAVRAAYNTILSTE